MITARVADSAAPAGLGAADPFGGDLFPIPGAVVGGDRVGVQAHVFAQAGEQRADAVLMDAYNTDVRPLLAGLREDMGLDPDPVAAYYRSGYAGTIAAERIGGTQAGWGS